MYIYIYKEFERIFFYPFSSILDTGSKIDILRSSLGIRNSIRSGFVFLCKKFYLPEVAFLGMCPYSFFYLLKVLQVKNTEYVTYVRDVCRGLLRC